jgi:hypothetical protein
MAFLEAGKTRRTVSIRDGRRPEGVFGGGETPLSRIESSVGLGLVGHKLVRSDLHHLAVLPFDHREAETLKGSCGVIDSIEVAEFEKHTDLKGWLGTRAPEFMREGASDGI